MTEPLKVLIVDDHALIAQGVQIALEAEGMEARVCAPTTAAEVIDEARSMEPSVVLLDLQLGGEIGTSIPLIGPLSETGAAVLVLTGVTDRFDLAACLEAGAVGLSSKSDPFKQLVDKVTALANDRGGIDQTEKYEMLHALREHRERERERHAPFESLSPREREVLAHLMEGKQADAIAEESYVSITTVRSHIRSVLVKLGVNSQLAAVAMAREAGWIPNLTTVN